MSTVPPPYNPQNDPRNDPRWQREQARLWRDQQKAYRDNWKQQAKAQRAQWRWYQRGFRRSSFIGPLLLVGVGIAFFVVQSGRVSALAFWSWYGRWWPLLLVLVGVLLMVEWAIDRATQKDGNLPARSFVGGGVVSLVILLAIVGIGASGVHDGRDFMGKNFSINGDNWDDLVGSKHESDPAPVVQPFAAGHALVIENPRGDVTVNGTSDDGQLHVMAHNEVRVTSDAEADKRLKALLVAVTESGATTSVTVPSVDHGRTDLVVTLPATGKVTVTANRGDVHVNGLKAAVMLTANHGDMDVAAISGGVNAHVNNRSSTLGVRNVKGPVVVEGTGDEANLSEIDGPVTVKGEFFGGGHMQHIRGAVTYETGRLKFALARLDGELNIESQDRMSADQVLGPFTVDTKNRNLALTRVTGDVKVMNNHGDVEIGSVMPTGAITVDNRNGSITVRMPEKAKFTLQADASGGQVNSDFALANESKTNDGSLMGTSNGGGSAIRLSTTHADISLVKNGALPLPPLPPVPKLSGVPAPPPPPGIPEDAQEAIREAREAAKAAEEEAHKAAADAREKAREADRLAHEAAKQKNQ